MMYQFRFETVGGITATLTGVSFQEAMMKLERLDLGFPINHWSLLSVEEM